MRIVSYLQCCDFANEFIGRLTAAAANPVIRLKRFELLAVMLMSVSFGANFLFAQELPAPTEISPGVWRITLGQPETLTPTSTRHYSPAEEGLAALPQTDICPVAVSGQATPRGFLVRIPLVPDELIYGLGLQLQSFQQRGLKKRLRVNADPVMDTGDSHAPVPFYVTTSGYGVFVDTARYTTFYLGNKVSAPTVQRNNLSAGDGNDGWNGVLPYEKKGIGQPSEVFIEVPQAKGVDIYIFSGPSLMQAVQRYNLFSGGGTVPPRWGLGFWYRVQTEFGQAEVLAMADEFRQRRIPCDVLGLEPRWQSHAYSSSYVWSSRFPKPAVLLQELTERHFRLNLWEQAFVHPSSPIYSAILKYAGDFEVWGGIVPDFLTAEGRKIFADYHEASHVALGVSGYKADECDNSDLTGNWSFPEISRFPSGADGEQMHQLFGLRYQDTIQSVFEKRRQRTYGLVRSSGALAAPYPYVLYSDLYEHRTFIRGVAQSGFSGLLWTPEVRDASGGPDELVRRLQAVAFSPLAMINAWYLKNPPWKQVNRAANNAGRFADDWEKAEAQCRTVIELRMKFIPYLHAAFVRYHREGIPPFRAVVMDYPDDPETHNLDDEYLMGDSLLVAPIIIDSRGGQDRSQTAADSGEMVRSVYLPAGDWYDFWTGERFTGKRRLAVHVPLDRIPLFVKAGTILPLATPTLHTDDPASWNLTVQVYGNGALPTKLFEDDGAFTPALPDVCFEWDAAKKVGRITGAKRYTVTRWKYLP